MGYIRPFATNLITLDYSEEVKVNNISPVTLGPCVCIYLPRCCVIPKWSKPDSSNTHEE